MRFESRSNSFFFRIELCRFRFQTDLLLIFDIPFNFAGSDVRRAFGQIGHYQFPGRIGLQLMVSDDSDIDFAPFDVFLGNCSRPVLPVDEVNALLELLVVATIDA